MLEDIEKAHSGGAKAKKKNSLVGLNPELDKIGFGECTPCQFGIKICKNGLDKNSAMSEDE
jgi:hypothetical protein